MMVSWGESPWDGALKTTVSMRFSASRRSTMGFIGPPGTAVRGVSGDAGAGRTRDPAVAVGVDVACPPWSGGILSAASSPGIPPCAPSG